MSRRPNILFLLSDQHNAGTLGCENHPDILTPHLDGLAEEGTRYERAYCQDAICVPSRCSLFTGLYPRTLGCMGNSDRTRAMESATSLATVLRDNGYQTAAFGKRHLHLGCDGGWDIKASHLLKESPNDNYVSWISDQGHREAFDRDWAAEWGHGAEGSPTSSSKIPRTVMSVAQTDLPRDMTMEAWTKLRTIEFLKNRTADQPFFCLASFYRPHQPYTPLPGYYERFDRSRWGKGRRRQDGLTAPASLRQPAADLPPNFQELFVGNNPVWRLDLARDDEQIYRDYLAAYYALVEEVDHHVGDILTALDEAGERENTIVIYTSDHGDFAGAHGMAEKCSAGHNIYEDTLRVPLIIRWPKNVQTEATCSDLVELVDIFPTLLDLCHIPAPALAVPPQGRSLAGNLLRGEPIGRSYCISENWTQATVITPRYKLGVWQEPGNPHWRDFRGFGDLLFDRETDPLEMRNLAGEPALHAMETELRNLLHNWQAWHLLPEAIPGFTDNGA